ncbi:hypothetical protein AO073_05950 [Pseudomonas syringae ICMP 11293]|uniref:hypothetical protein n=1 Tax=Pseudomonas syringae TaxID=317 RepID=UPI000730B2A7|nr:hypothetical protein [Pseudomonas syringae]KTB90882.1 hypothetical protein AO073_05950 [Pseudomonas syringae ICMP 11293]
MVKDVEIDGGAGALPDFSIRIAQAVTSAGSQSAVVYNFPASSVTTRVIDHDDNRPRVEDTRSMNEISREELNAKLETIETKMDARIEVVSAKIDSFVAIQVERDKRMEATLNQISANHGDIKSSIGSMKTTMIVTAVSTVLAIVIGIAGFNAMLTSNMVASFQMGRSEQAYQKNAEQPSPNPQSQPQQK